VREQDEVVAPIRPALRVLMVAVVLLLLIACLNVANLLLARTAARQQEMAIRVALGAGRGRVVRLLVTESALLAGAGALAGIVLAYAGVWTLRLLATTANRFDLGTGTDFPRLAEISLDGTVLAFTALTAAAAGITLGLISALRYVIGDTAAALRTAARATGGFWRTRVRAAFLVAEIAAAMVLLIGGGLVLRSYANLVGVDSGYQATNVLTFQVGMPLTRYPDDRLKAFAESLVAEARRIPGIERAAYANQLPMVRLRDTAGGLWRTADPERGGAPDAPDARIVSTEYLDVMGIRVVSGRGFTSGDGEGAPKVLLLNEALARRDFAGQEPVGQLVYVGRDTEPWQIVGIVDDVRQMALDEAPQPQFFVDMRQWQMARGLLFPVGAYYAVRTTGDPTQAVAPIRELVERIDSETALFNVAPMTQLIETTVSRPRMYAVLLGIFAAVGVALAVIGIYGLMTYVVAQETRNFGIRMALGAQRSQVLAMVLRRSLLLAAAGVGVGVVAAGMLTSGLERMLFGVTPLDTETFAAMAVLFLVVAAMAALVPARRATRIDPAIALRAE
jgi:putative ABC transport system permease protein